MKPVTHRSYGRITATDCTCSIGRDHKMDGTPYDGGMPTVARAVIDSLPPGVTPPGSPAWHALEAEQHLAEADKLASQAAGDPFLADTITRRLLAATANAQLGALKLALQQDIMLGDMNATLSELKRHADDAEWLRHNR